VFESQDNSDASIIATGSVSGSGSLLGRVRKIATSDYWLRHVCPSVRTDQLDFPWTDFHEISYLSIFKTSVGKFKFH
jgi:hypothetical protein